MDVPPVKALIEPVGLLVEGMYVGEALKDCPSVLMDGAVDGEVLGASDMSCSSSINGSFDDEGMFDDGNCDGIVESFPRVPSISIVGIMVDGLVVLDFVGDSDEVGKDASEGTAVGASNGDSDGCFEGVVLVLRLGWTVGRKLGFTVTATMFG